MCTFAKGRAVGVFDRQRSSRGKFNIPLKREQLTRAAFIILAGTAAYGASIAGSTARGPKPGTAFRDCDTGCPEMIVLPPGDLTMGSPEGVGSDQERPVHKIVIGTPFAVSKFEVTFDEWDACVADAGCKHKPDDRAWGRGVQPVLNVSWHDAKQYTAWLARKTGLHYRLLSEAEWEYAARAGTKTRFYFGDDKSLLSDFGWSVYNSENRAHPVGKKNPNRFGLYDMHGNVSEWVEDLWHATYDGAPTDGSIWSEGGDASRRVVRGGSWHTKPEWLRSAFRWGSLADSRSYICGFRVARTLSP